MFNEDPVSMRKLRNLVYSMIQMTKVFAPYLRVIYDEDWDCDMDDMFTKHMTSVNLNGNGNYTKGSVFRWGLIRSLYRPKTSNTSGMAISGTSDWKIIGLYYK